MTKEECEIETSKAIMEMRNQIAELEKENAELDCQMNRNKFCYSCTNATDRCFRNEIGCPCEKYKSYKDENAEMKEQLTKAKELLTKWVELFKPKGGNIPPTPIQVETEQFLSGQPEQIEKLKKMAALERKTVSAFIFEKTGVNKMNENKWFVANDDGDIIGHDMCEAKAKALAAEMQEKEPDAGWEAMNGDDE